eukprot:jgi/Bigna1/91702/estExt_fgenesh1_pg.C_1140018
MSPLFPTKSTQNSCQLKARSNTSNSAADLGVYRLFPSSLRHNPCFSWEWGGTSAEFPTPSSKDKDLDWEAGEATDSFRRDGTLCTKWRVPPSRERSYLRCSSFPDIRLARSPAIPLGSVKAPLPLSIAGGGRKVVVARKERPVLLEKEAGKDGFSYSRKTWENPLLWCLRRAALMRKAKKKTQAVLLGVSLFIRKLSVFLRVWSLRLSHYAVPPSSLLTSTRATSKAIMGQAFYCQCNSGAVEGDAAAGQYWVTPYGTGLEAKLSSTEIRKVKLSFGDAYVHIKNLKKAPRVSTPYGEGILIEKKDGICTVQLEFGSTKLKEESVKELDAEQEDIKFKEGALADKSVINPLQAQYWETPYGIGREVNPKKSDIQQVKLSFGDAYVHIKNLKKAETGCTSGDAKLQLWETPYGIGRKVNPNPSDIKQVKLSFGDAYVHIKNLKKTEMGGTSGDAKLQLWETPYGRGREVNPNPSDIKQVKLSFGDAYVHIKNLKKTEMGGTSGDAKLQLWETPYGRGREVNPNPSDIKQVKLSFGDAYVHIKNLKKTEMGGTSGDAKLQLWETPYGRGREVNPNPSDIKQVKLSFGDAYVHIKNLKKTEMGRTSGDITTIEVAANASPREENVPDASAATDKEAKDRTTAASEEAAATNKALQQLRDEHAKLLERERLLKEAVSEANAKAVAETARAKKAAEDAKVSVSSNKAATSQQVIEKEAALKHLREECTSLQSEKANWTTEKKALKNEITKLKASLEMSAKLKDNEERKQESAKKDDASKVSGAESSKGTANNKDHANNWMEWSAFSYDITKQIKGAEVWKLTIESVDAKKKKLKLDDGVMSIKGSNSKLSRSFSTKKIGSKESTNLAKSDMSFDAEGSAASVHTGKTFFVVTIVDDLGSVVGKPARTAPGDVSSPIYVVKGREKVPRFLFIQLQQRKERRDGSCYNSDFEFSFIDLNHLGERSDCTCHLPLYNKPVCFTRDLKKTKKTGGQILARISLLRG